MHWPTMTACGGVVKVGGVGAGIARAFSGLRIGNLRTAAPAPVRAAPGVLAAAALRSWPASTRQEVLGARAAGGMMQTGSAATVVVARSRGLGVPVAVPAAVRSISATPPREKGLNDFFVSFPEIDKDGKPMFPAVGRAWTAAELRQKSFEDLHKLWWILLKERNSLAAERHAARARGLEIPNPRRILKVRKSMSRIKCVLGERKRMKELIKAQAEEAQAEQQM